MKQLTALSIALALATLLLGNGMAMADDLQRSGRARSDEQRWR